MSAVPSVGAPPPHPRHAFGWPAGSIRALLALSVLGLMWVLALRPVLKPPPSAEGAVPLGTVKLPMEFVYLQILMVLILAHYFAAHGSSIRPGDSGRSPLGLPRGSVRFLLLAGYLGLAVYLWRNHSQFEVPATGNFMLLLTVLLSAFLVGHLVTGVVRRFSGGVLPPAFQDIMAWIALLAFIALAGVFVVHVFINPGQPEEQKIDMPTLEAILSGLCGFYFGARS
jgi:hypothetical protein